MVLILAIIILIAILGGAIALLMFLLTRTKEDLARSEREASIARAKNVRDRKALQRAEEHGQQLEQQCANLVATVQSSMFSAESALTIATQIQAVSRQLRQITGYIMQPVSSRHAQQLPLPQEHRQIRPVTPQSREIGGQYVSPYAHPYPDPQAVPHNHVDHGNGNGPMGVTIANGIMRYVRPERSTDVD